MASQQRGIAQQRGGRKGGRHRVRRSPAHQPYKWLGAGALTLGFGAALAQGSPLAHADETASSRGPAASGPKSDAGRPATTATGATARGVHLRPAQKPAPAATGNLTQARGSLEPGASGHHLTAPTATDSTSLLPSTRVPTRVVSVPLREATAGPATADAPSAELDATPSSPITSAVLAAVPTRPQADPGQTRALTTAAVITSAGAPGTQATPSAAILGLAALAAVTTATAPTASSDSQSPLVRSVLATKQAGPVVGAPDPTTGVVTGSLGITGKITITQPAHGSVTVTSKGIFTFTPTQAARQTAGAATTETFKATVRVFFFFSKSVTVTVPVDPGTPVAKTPSVGTPTSATGQVTGSAVFADTAGRAVTYSAPITSTGGGTVTVNANTGAYTYTPTQSQRQSAGASTTDTFTVTASNGVRSTTETITVAVDPGTPVTGTATVGTPDSGTGKVTGAAVFSDTAGRTLKFSTTGKSVGGGTVSVNSTTGAYTYTPTQTQRQGAGANTTDTFTITASNGIRNTDETITVAVDPGTPVAGTPTIGTPNSNTGAVTGTSVFTDTAGRTLSYSTPTTTTAGGSVTLNTKTGAYTYTPTQEQRQAATLTTTDTFTVTASNGIRTSTQTITVPVDAGTPTADTPTVGTPDPDTGAVTGNAAFTDPAGRTLTYSTSGDSVGGGTISVNTNTGAYTYTPTQTQRLAAGTTTDPITDTFTVTASNGVHTATQTITVPVSAIPDVPVAGTPTVGTPNTKTGVVTGTAAFTDPAKLPLVFSTTGKSVGGGTVSVNSTTGAYTYTPTQTQRQGAGANTTDTFTITASNGIRNTDETITVAVDPGTPVAGTPTIGTPNSNTGAVTGTSVFTDTAGRTLSYSTPTTTTAGGSVTLNTKTGAYTYTPTQEQRQAATLTTTDTFTVTASNGIRTSTQTITVPVDAGTPTADTPTVGTPDPDTGAVTGNAAFTDPAGRTLTYSTSGDSVGGGTISVNTNTGAYTYTPTQTQRLAAGTTTDPITDTFTVTASNGVHTATQTITVPVSAIPDVPVAGTPTVGTPNTKTGVVTGTAAFTDPAKLPLTYTVTTGPARGSLTVTASGAFTYTPTTAARLTAAATSDPVSDTFTISATNGIATTTQTVTVPVSPMQFTLTADIPTYGRPAGLAMSPDGKYVYIALEPATNDPFYPTGPGEYLLGSVGVIDTATNTASFVYTAPGNAVYGPGAAPHTQGGDPTAVAVSPNGKYLYVAYTPAAYYNRSGVSVYDLSTNQLIALPADQGGRDLVVSRDSNRVYVSDGTVINGVNNTAYGGLLSGGVTSPGIGSAVAISPDGGHIYITNMNANTLSVVSTNGATPNLTTISVGTAPFDVAVSQDGHYVYVTNLNSNSVSVIDTTANTVAATIAVDKAPAGVALSPDGSVLYVTTRSSSTYSSTNGGGYYSTVSMIDTATNTVIGTPLLLTGGSPSLGYGPGVSPGAITVSPDGSHLYVSNSTGYTVSVYSA